MEKTYQTSEIAKIIGIHENTVRKYEEWQFITKPKRSNNGYRIFNELHIYQFKIARLAVRCEIVENGLRKKAIEIIKATATEDFDAAIILNDQYIEKIEIEKQNSLKAIDTVNQLLKRKTFTEDKYYFRKDVLARLDLKPDTLRNWERNGLLKTKRKENGYKIYTDKDLQIINIIKTLRLANYSLSSILRMLNTLERENNPNIQKIIDNPEPSEDIISVCDRLLTSLDEVKKDAYQIQYLLQEVTEKF